MKPGRKPKDPTTIDVMGKLSELRTAQPVLTKYNDLGTLQLFFIQPITNTLIDLGEDINVMKNDLFTTLELCGLRHMTIVLPNGVLEDVVITIASLRYSANFLL